MLWKKDKLKPTQPYFVFDTVDFRQEVYLRKGISHFYSFHTDSKMQLRLVPDGCIDIFFEFQKGHMCGYARGTKLAYSLWDGADFDDIFGVRFMPGVQPQMLGVTMRDILGQVMSIEHILKGDTSWLGEMEKETDFYQRIRIFLEHYMNLEKKKEKPFGKKELIWSVKRMVYESDGKVKVSEMKEQTGYSERYINKVFIEEMGFSPKTFCKIIQFQRALEFMNYGAPDNMADAAVYLGYYDQSQFIRDFTRYAGITPKKYLKLVQSQDYRKKVQGFLQ